MRIITREIRGINYRFAICDDTGKRIRMDVCSTLTQRTAAAIEELREAKQINLALMVACRRESMAYMQHEIVDEQITKTLTMIGGDE